LIQIKKWVEGTWSHLPGSKKLQVRNSNILGDMNNVALEEEDTTNSKAPSEKSSANPSSYSSTSTHSGRSGVTCSAAKAVGRESKS
jgi:hypothetical protein